MSKQRSLPVLDSSDRLHFRMFRVAHTVVVVAVVVYLAIAANASMISLQWSLFGCACILTLLAVPWYPLAGLGALAVLEYGPDRYNPDFVSLLTKLHLLEWFSALLLLGWVIWAVFKYGECA